MVISNGKKNLQQTTAELEEIRRRYQELYDNHIDGVVETDIEGNFVDCNPAFARMLGYDRVELIGRNYREVTPEDWREWEDRLVEERIVATGASGMYEKEYVRKDGTIFPVELNSYLIRDAAGNPAGMWAFARDITDRKRAEEALRESERLLQETGRMARVGGWEYDLESQTIFWTDVVYDILGLTPGSPLPAGEALDYYEEETRRELDRSIARAQEEGEGWDIEGCFHTADGEVRWARIIGKAVQEGERITLLRGTFQDITDRKQAEMALRESEARFANLMQSVPLAIQGYEIDGTVWYWNRASERIYGYSAEEAIGKKLDELIIPEAILPMYRQGLEGARGITQSGEFLPAGEVCLRRKDGSSVVVHSIHTAACVEGLPPMLFCIDMDISERRKAEEALRQSEEKYRQVVENANESILIAQTGKILFCNEKTEELSGYTAEELLRLPFADLIHPQDREMVAERHARRMAGEEFEHIYPFRIRRKDGETRWVQINAVRIQWQGEPATLNFLIDITEQRDTERKLMHQMEQAEKLNQFMIGREKRVIEMKREVNALLTELGRQPKYGV